MCITFKTAAPADYFGNWMKTVSKELLKLWLSEVAQHYGSHFDKTALKDFAIPHIFLHNWDSELAKLPECFHGDKLEKGVQHAGVL